MNLHRSFHWWNWRASVWLLSCIWSRISAVGWHTFFCGKFVDALHIRMHSSIQAHDTYTHTRMHSSTCKCSHALCVKGKPEVYVSTCACFLTRQSRFELMRECLKAIYTAAAAGAAVEPLIGAILHVYVPSLFIYCICISLIHVIFT